MEGYGKLSVLCTKYPDLCIFRRFLTLSIRNVLCLQAQLVQQEADLQTVMLRDHTSGDPERQQYQFGFDHLLNSSEGKREQLDLTLESGATLHKYTKALKDVRYLLELSPANRSDLRAVRDFVFRTQKGHPSFLPTFEHDTWEPMYEDDLVSLNKSFTNRGVGQDFLSTWISKTVVPWYHNLLGRKLHDSISLAECGWIKAAERIEKNMNSGRTSGNQGDQHQHTSSRIRAFSDTILSEIVYYPNSTAAGVVSAAATVLAPLLPVVAMCVLYFVRRPVAKLGVTGLLTFVFSLAVKLLTAARPLDAFIASSTFAAVLVVFVGSEARG